MTTPIAPLASALCRAGDDLRIFMASHAEFADAHVRIAAYVGPVARETFERLPVENVRVMRGAERKRARYSGRIYGMAITSEWFDVIAEVV